MALFQLARQREDPLVIERTIVADNRHAVAEGAQHRQVVGSISPGRAVKRHRVKLAYQQRPSPEIVFVAPRRTRGSAPSTSIFMTSTRLVPRSFKSSSSA